MKTRPVDEYHDWKPVYAASQMLVNQDAAHETIYSRLHFNLGDWWEDETLGFEVPQFLMDGARNSRQMVPMLVHYIEAYILETEGISSLAWSRYSYEKHVLTMSVGVVTEWGDVVEGSVTLDELYGAQT